MKFSPRVDQIAGEGAAAWNIHERALAAQARGEDIIALSVGDPDLATPQPIVERAYAALAAGDTHYTDGIGEHPLRAAVARHFTNRSGLAVGPDNVCVTSGAQNALFFASMLLLGPGDEAIMLCPGYVTYEATIGASGAQAVAVDLRAEDNFRPDPDAIRAAITPRTRALFLTTPNNPTGVVLTREELSAIADIAREHDLWVVSDEVYSEIVFDGEHHSIAALPGMAGRTVTVSSLSKSHAMTGWRSGWLIGPEALIAHAANLGLCALYGLPGFIQKAAIVALEQADAITSEFCEIYRRRRDLVVDTLGRVSAVDVQCPQAGMFAMVDVRGTGLDSGDFGWRLLEEQGVSVLDGNAFGPSAAGHIRLSYTLDDARLAEACRRIEALCASLRNARASTG